MEGVLPRPALATATRQERVHRSLVGLDLEIAEVVGRGDLAELAGAAEHGPGHVALMAELAVEGEARALRQHVLGDEVGGADVGIEVRLLDRRGAWQVRVVHALRGRPEAVVAVALVRLDGEVVRKVGQVGPGRSGGGRDGGNGAEQREGDPGRAAAHLAAAVGGRDGHQLSSWTFRSTGLGSPPPANPA